MKWASAVSFEADIATALTELKRNLYRQLDGEHADLVVAFLTPHYESFTGEVSEMVASRFRSSTFLGCTATGVIGGGQEIEDRAAVAMMAAVLPGVEIHPFRLQADDLPDLDEAPDHWLNAIGLAPRPRPHFIVLVDPTGDSPFDPRPLLMGLDFAFPNATKVGGLASVLQGNRLFLNEHVISGGCVGVALHGNLEVDTVVAQGCRPIGGPMVITDCSGYYLTELDERSAVEVLVELYHSLAPEDQELVQSSLHIGIASTGLKEDLGHGDFLIRNVISLDHEKQLIAVGDTLQPGQTVQFHLRDAGAAREDLQAVLTRYRREQPDVDPAGALLFTCTGRGRHLFAEADHDSGCFSETVGDVPLGGFFCGGEIGSVGDSTYLHGYTSSFAIFRPADYELGLHTSEARCQIA